MSTIGPTDVMILKLPFHSVSVRFVNRHRQKYINIYLPWAIRSAYNSKFLMNVYFENRWEQDLDEMRKELNLIPAPVPLKKTGKKTVTK